MKPLQPTAASDRSATRADDSGRRHRLVSALVGPGVGRALLGGLALLGCSPADAQAIAPVVLPASPDDLPDEQRFLAEIDRSRGYRDVFSVIADPVFVASTEAGLQPGEMVLGVDLGDARFAYPVNLLNHHEIVEHTSNGRELLVCW